MQSIFNRERTLKSCDKIDMAYDIVPTIWERNDYALKLFLNLNQ